MNVAFDRRDFVKGALCGGMALVEATPSGYVEKGRFRPPRSSTGQAWAHPVIAGSRLYLRDQELRMCYDLKSQSGTRSPRSRLPLDPA